MGAARMVGDTSLYKKMEQAEQDIKRDIVFAASLVSGHTVLFGIIWIDVWLHSISKAILFRIGFFFKRINVVLPVCPCQH